MAQINNKSYGNDVKSTKPEDMMQEAIEWVSRDLNFMIETIEATTGTVTSDEMKASLKQNATLIRFGQIKTSRVTKANDISNLLELAGA